jgi:hypothetical protein
MADRNAYEVAEAAVRVLDAAELPDLPDVWEAYWAHPVPPTRLAERERLLGSGLGSTLAEWAPLVVAYLGLEVFAGAAVDAAKAQVRRGAKHVWSTLRRPDPAVVRFDPEQVAVVAEEARTAALAAGRTAEEANRFAEAVVRALDQGDG